MLRSVYDFRRFTVAATDGSLGRVDDLYFDDRNWAVRYLAVDAGDWLPGHRVLVSPIIAPELGTNHTSRRVQQTAGRDQAGEHSHPRGAREPTTGRVVSSPRWLAPGRAEICISRTRPGFWATPSRPKTERSVTSRMSWWTTRRGQSATSSSTPRTGGRARTSWCHREWLTRVTWDESKTLFCLVTAVDDDTARGGPRGHRSTVER